MTNVKAAGTGVGSGSNVARDGNQTDTIRKLQDSYTEREVDQNKKHREEMQVATQMHKEELSKNQEQYDRSLRDLKVRSDDALTKQDMAYQKEIKDLKDMYTKHMEKVYANYKKQPENGTEEA